MSVSKRRSEARALFDSYSVLLLEGSQILQGLFEHWLSEITVRFVSSVDEIDTRVDATVVVACLCQDRLGDEASEVRKRILTTNPYCQLVLIVPQSGFITLEEDNYDAILQRPVFKEELQTTVEECLTRGVYSVLLREFYRLNVRLHWVEQPDSEDGDASDTDPNHLYARYNTVRNHLQSLQAAIDPEEITSIARSIELHKQYLREPDHDATETRPSKYHPKRCPQCNLSWGHDHGNELGVGFERGAAHVWRCTGCNEVVHGLGESHRRVNY